MMEIHLRCHLHIVEPKQHPDLGTGCAVLFLLVQLAIILAACTTVTLFPLYQSRQKYSELVKSLDNISVVGKKKRQKMPKKSVVFGRASIGLASTFG